MKIKCFNIIKLKIKIIKIIPKIQINLKFQFLINSLHQNLLLQKRKIYLNKLIVLKKMIENQKKFMNKNFKIIKILQKLLINLKFQLLINLFF